MRLSMGASGDRLARIVLGEGALLGGLGILHAMEAAGTDPVAVLREE